MRAYIGAATTGGGGSSAAGITVADVDDGWVKPIGVGAQGVDNPMYVARSADGRVLFTVHEVAEGRVSAWAVDGDTLTPLGVPRPTGGSGPCHLSVHPSGRFVLTADYGSGSISVHRILADGALDDATHVVQHSGSGPNGTRQDGPHAHMIVTDPVRGHVLATDLGTDTVYRYDFDESTGRLALADEIRVAAGSGPRHLVLAGDHAYVVNELSSTISVIDLTAPAVVADVPTHPGTDRGGSQPSAIRLDPTGRFLYVANRGPDEVAALTVDGPDVSLVATVPCGGTHPRDLEVDPSGRYLYVANQFSDALVTFRLDPETGVPERRDPVLETPSPASILFA
ncbi:lactonase family protein [Jiangella asiatica]|uniref:Lactonase family protein n=1 Tax=Jiangella asiatica TaxID=2530372 RepID=A0A4V2Z2C0_9ACTN|nr:lactonase family protein [Jiangella asiatica]TDE08238.1 lactonase family protein [Jiangella asiatica]